jgi:hypothetical protein
MFFVPTTKRIRHGMIVAGMTTIQANPRAFLSFKVVGTEVLAHNMQ